MKDILVKGIVHYFCSFSNRILAKRIQYEMEIKIHSVNKYQMTLGGVFHYVTCIPVQSHMYLLETFVVVNKMEKLKE